MKFFSRHFKHNVLSATYQKMADLRNRCLYCKFPGNREKNPEWQSVYLMYENRHRWIINQFQVMRDHEFGPIRRSIIKFSIPCPTENYGRKSICWSEFHYILKDQIKSNSCPFYSQKALSLLPFMVLYYSSSTYITDLVFHITNP